MQLLYKNVKLLHSFAFFCFFALLFSSCENNDFSVGTNLTGEGALSTLYIDSCTVELSTISIDSMNSVRTGGALVGKYRSAEYGDVSVFPYFTFKTTTYNGPALSSDPTAPRFDPILDSITLLFKTRNKHYYGDTTVNQQLLLYRLTEKVEKNDLGLLTTRSSFAYDPTPIGQKSVRVLPSIESDSLQIRLPDAFGQELLDKLYNTDEDISTNDKFVNYFKGLVIGAANNNWNSAITGYVVSDSTVMLRLYYHTIENRKVERMLDFEIDEELQFNQVVADRSSTPLIFKKEEDYTLPSSVTNDRSYLQGLTALYTKVDFPHLNTLLLTGKYSGIVKAELILRPEINQEQQQIYPLPPKLLIYSANQDGSQPIEIANDGVSQNGNLKINELYPRETYYSFDITSFLKQELGKLPLYKKSVLIYLPTNDGMNQSFQSVSFLDQSRPERQKEGVELRIYYMTYNEPQ